MNKMNKFLNDISPVQIIGLIAMFAIGIHVIYELTKHL